MIVIGALPNLSSQVAYLALGHLPPSFQERGVLWVLKNERLVERALALWAFFNESAPTRWPQEPMPLYLKAPGLVITSETMLNAPVLSKQGFQTLTISVKPGDRWQLSKLKTRLVNNGYVQETAANQPGTFASRGSILDIWPLHLDHPIRIEFDEEVISNISSFDWITLSKQDALKSADIVPARVDGTDATLIDLIKDVALITSDEEFAKEFKNVIFFSPFSSGAEVDLQIQTSPVESRRQALQKFHPSRRTIISTTHPEKIPELFPNAQLIPGIHGLGSFDSPSLDLMFLTDDELFPGAHRRKTVSERKDTAEFVSSLEAGSNVVHIFHGIARYKGLTTMEVNNVEREYLILEFSGKDRMYVPVELSDRIDAYVGSPKPKLNSLSDTQWSQAVVRTQKEAMEMAKELLDLYAKRELAKAPKFGPETAAEREAAGSFPFELTTDQRAAWENVRSDLESSIPTDRLIVGDVGFGKTEIALRAAMKAVANGYQAAVLAPTTILVQQHLQTFTSRLSSIGVKIAPLSRFESPKDVKATIAGIKDGSIDIVIGTHRLLSKDVIFDHPGLLIIDEEQRFGVKHKESIKQLKTSIHTLTLTATPIPRTLNMSMSGLRDLSTISTAPPGRIPIETVIAPFSDAQLKEGISRELRRHGQVYYLFNQVRAIEGKAVKLREMFPQARIGVAHGQMPSGQLASIMNEFREGHIDILVCSTIVENGLDLPNVNSLIVEKAQSLGLGQLYQLRGRIGRGLRQGYAYFLYTTQKLSPAAQQRLKALEEARGLGAGFELAMRDLEIRGAGSILGAQQSGRISEIGLHLYTKLLSQAVQELRTGKVPPPIRDISIDLPLDSRIPRDVVKEEKERLKLYQRLARSESEKALEDEVRRAETVWTNITEKLAPLTYILQLRLLAQPTTVTSIDTVYPAKTGPGVAQSRIVINVSESPSEEIQKTIREFGGRTKEQRIQLHLQGDWQKQLLKIIRLLKQ